jgi:hypothetical protein
VTGSPPGIAAPAAELTRDDATVTYRGLAVLNALPRLRKFAPGISGSTLDLEQFRRANPRIQIIGFGCGTPRARRESELEQRQLGRLGLKGQIRLAWRALSGLIG